MSEPTDLHIPAETTLFVIVNIINLNGSTFDMTLLYALLHLIDILMAFYFCHFHQSPPNQKLMPI